MNTMLKSCLYTLLSHLISSEPMIIPEVITFLNAEAVKLQNKLAASLTPGAGAALTILPPPAPTPPPAPAAAPQVNLTALPDPHTS